MPTHHDILIFYHCRPVMSLDRQFNRITNAKMGAFYSKRSLWFPKNGQIMIKSISTAKKRLNAADAKALHIKSAEPLMIQMRRSLSLSMTDRLWPCPLNRRSCLPPWSGRPALKALPYHNASGQKPFRF